MATDGAAEAVPAMEAAVDLANGTGSELHVVYVLSTVAQLPFDHAGTKDKSEAILEQRRLRAFRLLEQQAGFLTDIGGGVAATHYREGSPEKEVVDLAGELEAGMIVTGGRKRPWYERIFGAGFSTSVLRKAGRPVLVVGQRGSRSPTVPK